MDHNRNDPAYKPLFEAAGRIAALLKATTADPLSELPGTLDDFLGAVYALIFAKQHGFTNRLDRATKIAAVEKLADQISAGRLPTDKKWMAGFHFNSALFRTAAVSHRILQLVVGESDNVPTLCDKAEKRYPKWKPGRWSSGNVRKVCTEVNKLKHEPKGLHERRNVAYEDALAAVCELLDLMEAWSAALEHPDHDAVPGAPRARRAARRRSAAPA
jgi:hypothetical protein